MFLIQFTSIFVLSNTIHMKGEKKRIEWLFRYVRNKILLTKSSKLMTGVTANTVQQAQCFYFFYFLFLCNAYCLSINETRSG